MKKTQWAVLLMMPALLSGCFEEEEEGFGSTADSATAITITAENGKEVTAEAMGSSFAAEHASARGATPQKMPPLYTRPLTEVLNEIRSNNQRRGLEGLANSSVQELSEACVDGGSKDFSINLDTDQFTLRYNQCDEYGELSSGSATGSLIGDQFTINYSGLSIVNSEVQMTINGAVTYTETEHSDHVLTVLNSSSFSVSMTYLGRNLTISKLQLTERDFESAAYWQSDFSYTANSSQLGGSFTLRTLQSELQNYSSENPYQGQYKISGANGSNLVLTVQDTRTLLIEIDADGDGAIDSSESISFDELEQLLKS